MLQAYKHHIWLHLTVLIFGLTGILGKLISADSYLLVWYRVGIAVVALLLYFFFKGHSLKISKKQLQNILLTGAILAVHWVAFFEAIKQSNVSVALVCISSSTLFTSLIEPFYFKRKIKPYEFIFGLLIVVGLYFIFSFEFKYLAGMLLSILAAVLASWMTVLNGIWIKDTNAKTISFYELLGAFILVSLYLMVVNGGDVDAYKIAPTDIKWLVILGTLCTAFAFIVSVEVMKKISPYTVSISINLEPIYSIVLALIIWPESETMSFGFYMGTIIVIATIFLNAFLKKRGRKVVG
ncbi:MAG: EamA family transporter [Vicingus serpentipes]|nr:EamA family transporter [Vicingus serpentipes]